MLWNGAGGGKVRAPGLTGDGSVMLPIGSIAGQPRFGGLPSQSALSLPQSGDSAAHRTAETMSTRPRLRLLITFVVFALGVSGTIGSPASAANAGQISGIINGSRLTLDLFLASGATPVASIRDHGGFAGIEGLEGDYAFNDVEPGVYHLRVTGATSLTHWHGGTSDRSTAANITVEPGGIATVNHDARLRPIFRASIGVPGVSYPSVTLLRLVGDELVETPRTMTWSSSTEVTIHPDAEGTFIASVRVWDNNGYPYYSGDVFNRSAASTLAGSSGVRVEFAIQAPRKATLGARLANVNGGSVYGRLSAFILEQGEIVPLTPRFSPSAAEPSSQISVPADLPVTLRAEPPSGSSDGFQPTWLGNVASPDLAAYRTLVANELRATDVIRMPGGRTAVGVMQDSAGISQPNAVVRAVDKSGQVVSEGVTDSDGEFELPHLPSQGRGDPFGIFISGEGFLSGYIADPLTDDPAEAAPMWLNATVNAITVTFSEERSIVAVNPPVLLGENVRGSRLTLSPGDWTNDPELSFKWWRTTAGVSGQTLVQEGPATDYDIGEDQPLGSTYRVEVLAQRAGYGSARVFAQTQLPLVAFAVIKPITYEGSLVPGQTLYAVPPEFNVNPESIEYIWSPTGSGATSYTLTTADVGMPVVLTAVGVRGSATAQSRYTSPGVVKAISRLVVKAKSPKPKRVKLRVRLLTPGAFNPGGFITISRGSKVVATSRVPTRGDLVELLRSPKGKRTFKVEYSGSPSALPSLSSVRVRVQR